MKRSTVLFAAVLAMVAGACAPIPPNDAVRVVVVSDEFAFGNPQVYETLLDPVSIYRASVTSVVLGPVELCLIVESFSRPPLPTPCETIYAVPGTQYSATFQIEDPDAPRGAALLLVTKTAGPAFVGTLSVIQGQPLRPRPSQ